MQVRKTLKGIALSAAVAVSAVTGVLLVTAAPAQATVVNYSCITNGEFGEWRATGYRNGRFWWDGPTHVLRSTALGDCKRWLQNPYQD